MADFKHCLIITGGTVYRYFIEKNMIENMGNTAIYPSMRYRIEHTTADNKHYILWVKQANSFRLERKISNKTKGFIEKIGYYLIQCESTFPRMLIIRYVDNQFKNPISMLPDDPIIAKLSKYHSLSITEWVAKSSNNTSLHILRLPVENRNDRNDRNDRNLIG